MPFEKDVQERKTWWCPKWYWPFAVCSGIRTQHKWCYNFAWVRETRYGFVLHLEGCENGRLFTWTRPGLGLGSTTYPAGEMCFDSSLGPDEGRCDPSRTGLLASGLAASEPFASDIDHDVLALQDSVAETGSFAFTGENERLCQKGAWPWRRTLHAQMVVASVATRFVQVQWYLGGIPVSGASGTVQAGASCHWPFPLPKGRGENRLVQLRYEIVTEPNKSTLKLFNDPADGCYGLSIGMTASEQGRPYHASYSQVSFRGETCDFAPEQLADLAACLRRFSDLAKDKAEFQKPRPGEPVIVFADELIRLIRDEDQAVAQPLMEIIRTSFQSDPAVSLQAKDLLARQLGLPGLGHLLTIAPAARPEATALSTHLAPTSRDQPLAAALAGLGIGLLIGRLLAGRAGRGARR